MILILLILYCLPILVGALAGAKLSTEASMVVCVGYLILMIILPFGLTPIAEFFANSRLEDLASTVSLTMWLGSPIISGELGIGVLLGRKHRHENASAASASHAFRRDRET